MSENHCNLESAVEKLIREHFDLDENLEKVIWIKSGRTPAIGVLEINPETPPTGEVLSFYFPPSDEKPYALYLAEIKPEEWQKVLQNEILLPDGWSLENHQAFSREMVRLTLDQADRLAAGRPFELINGTMHFKTADFNHARAQTKLGKALGNYFDANRIGEVLTELTHRLWPENPYEGRMPDLSVILNEHIEEGERYPTRAPDIAIEIISQDDPWTGLFAKARLYFEKGSREVWLVDSYERGIMVVTPTSRHWVLDTFTSELLPGFQVDLKRIFTRPAASAAEK